MTPPLLLRTLGAASLGPDTAEPADALLGPGKPLALLTYLALSPRRTATREHLLDLLWADNAPEGARRNLRQTLYLLRRLLGDDCLAADGDALTLAAAVRLDTDAFAAAVNAGDLRAAVDLYGGPFFPSFAAPGGAGFEHWADVERQRLHNTFLRALESLAREALGRRQAREAVVLARRLRDSDPERESGWRLLMEALIAAGNWVEAAVEADACDAALADQARAPEPGTVAAVRASRQAPEGHGSAPARLAAEMIGREAEFATVISAWNAARLGRLVHVHVTGTAGIGKTRLLRDAAARIAAVGGRVVSARANQGERDLPYALAGDLTRALAALPGSGAIAPVTAGVLLGLDPALSARFPGARHAVLEGEDALRLRTMALADLLTAVAEEQPLALIVDDLHWADAASRHLVTGLASRAANHPVLLLTAARPVPDGAPPGRPDEVLTLRPLSLDQTAALMDSLATVPDGLRAAGAVAALHDSAGGSPLLALETLQHAVDNGWLARDADTWQCADLGALLHALAAGSALDRRLSALNAPARRVLLTLAASGAPVHDRILLAMTRHADHDTAATALALEQHGFAVRRADGSWDASHDSLAETLLAAASRTDLEAAHAALGHALADAAGDDPTQLRRAARHLRVAGERLAMLDVFRRFVRGRRQLGDTRPTAAMAPDLFGDFPAADLRALVRALPLTLRITRRMWGAAAGVAAVLALGAGYGWLTTAERLAVTQFMPFEGAWSRDRPIAVEALDRRGRRDRRRQDTVFVEAAPRQDGIAIRPEPNFAVMRDGRAEFPTLHLETGGPRYATGTTLRFRAPALGAVESDTVVLTSALFLDSAVVNGQRLSPASRAVTLEPGELLRGRVWLHYTMNSNYAAVLMATVPTWGDRTRFILPRALTSQTVRDTASQGIEFPGPTVPGRYRIVFAAQMETEAKFVASGTNWSVQRPVWHDGNDIADIGDSAATTLNAVGRLEWPWLRLPDGNTHQTALDSGRVLPRQTRTSQVSYGRVWLTGTTLDVIVR